MTVKNRGIRLKQQLSEDDQGHRSLLQVTHLLQRGPEEARQHILRARRRALIRLLRDGLEDTLELLDEALATAEREDPAWRVGRP